MLSKVEKKAVEDILTACKTKLQGYKAHGAEDCPEGILHKDLIKLIEETYTYLCPDPPEEIKVKTFKEFLEEGKYYKFDLLGFLENNPVVLYCSSSARSIRPNVIVTHHDNREVNLYTWSQGFEN